MDARGKVEEFWRLGARLSFNLDRLHAPAEDREKQQSTRTG